MQCGVGDRCWLFAQQGGRPCANLRVDHTWSWEKNWVINETRYLQNNAAVRCIEHRLTAHRRSSSIEWVTLGRPEMAKRLEENQRDSSGGVAHDIT